MGMDVYGRNPSCEEGRYFRASIWSWRPIHGLMRQLCCEFVSDEVLFSMGFNDGAGPEDQETCDKIAKAFDKWMEHNASGVKLETPEIHAGLVGALGFDHYLLKEWVTFLRSCGGFKVL